jgi:hypothetical protein
LSINTIDVNNTQAPGYLWYTQIPGGDALSASQISVSNSILTEGKDPASATWQGLISGLVAAGVGQSFGSGGYFECRMAYDPALSNGDGFWPAFDFTVYSGFHLHQVPFTEVDMFEAIPGSPPTESFYVNRYTNLPITLGGDSKASNPVPSPGLTPDANFHRYGTLWVPMALNGGTGLIQRYVDGAHLTSCDVSYTAIGPASPGMTGANPNGCLSELDSQENQIVLYAGKSWPVQWDYVMALVP